MKKGIASIQQYKEFCKNKIIVSSSIIRDNQFQPNSLDLTLGKIAYRVKSGFICDSQRIDSIINELLMYKIDLSKEAILEKNCIYIIPLNENLHLPSNIYGLTNPKSTTGRLDVFTRILTDYNFKFNSIQNGYNGILYLEVCPKSFSIKVKEGDSLTQLRLVINNNCKLDDNQIKNLGKYETIIKDTNPDYYKLNNGLFLSIDLNKKLGDIVGYKAKKNTNIIDISKINHYYINDFWEPLYSNNSMILEPEEFYIFMSKEKINIPNCVCSEMVPFDQDLGEFRTHYAGFFDSGFNAKAILEVRLHNVPFLIKDGQYISRLIFNEVYEKPRRLYGNNSNYQNQRLKLAKQFKNE